MYLALSGYSRRLPCFSVYTITPAGLVSRQSGSGSQCAVVCQGLLRRKALAHVVHAPPLSVMCRSLSASEWGLFAVAATGKCFRGEVHCPSFL